MKTKGINYSFSDLVRTRSYQVTPFCRWLCL